MSSTMFKPGMPVLATHFLREPELGTIIREEDYPTEWRRH